MFLPETKSVPALRDWAGMLAEDEPPLAALVARVRKDKKLSALFEQGATLLYEKNDVGEYAPLTDWKPPAEDEAGLCLLLAIASLASIRVAHALRHVDSQITRATCQDIGIALARWKKVYATPESPIGLERSLLPWFRLLASGELYRLGRLEFVREVFAGAILALREKSTGKIALLAADGGMFDSSGYLTEVDSPGGFITSLQTSDNAITGNTISSLGQATRETKTFSLSDWEVILKNGDPILEIHVPEGEALDTTACEKSMEEARAFFRAKYPNTASPVAFICSSWLLDASWQTRLGEEANIVQFQKLGYLFPVPSGRREGLYYIFGRTDVDVASAPKETVLQQAMLRAYENEEPLRSGGLFIPI